MCEVLNADGTPHPTNTRSVLRQVAEKYQEHEPWFGFEQEYTLYRKDWPYGWPKDGFPHPQGKYYCGVGSDEVYGRRLVEAIYTYIIYRSISFVKSQIFV
jgi:glutamine synthetase